LERKNNLISKTRLISQKIALPESKTPSEIMSWMGAMQAQDYLMAKWTIGVRLKDPTDKKVESAIDKGEILRIHILRPTWHFVSADDIYWMLQLSASKIKSSLKSRHSQLELTLEDFIWWSNLTIKDARKAIDLVKSDFFLETMGSTKYLIPNSYSKPTLEKASVHLLPAYDEFLISYRDRSSSLLEVNNKRTVSDNGIFYPTIVVNGQVAGLWKRTFQKNQVIVSVSFFNPTDDSTIKKIEIKVRDFGRFLEKETELIQKTE